MYLVALVALLVAVAGAARVPPKAHQLTGNYTFAAYIHDFGKTYASARERAERGQTFRANLARILAHNADSKQTWKQGVNRFTDRTPAELSRLRGISGAIHREAIEQPARFPAAKRNVSAAALPAAIDWRTRGVLTPVKDQGECGSCWTFSTVECVEAYWALSTGRLQEFSEQFVLDCTVSNGCGGTGGCQGATPTQAFATIMKYGGIPSEWTYGYSSYGGGNGARCLFNRSTTPVIGVLKGSEHFARNVDQKSIMEHLATVGPLIIEVDAGSWSSYESGILGIGGNGCSVNATIDHGVLLVGYGTDQGQDYWLVRNSWSPQWGEDGYIRLTRQSLCGVDSSPLAGNGCPGGPKSVPVCGTCGLQYSISYPIV